MKCDLNPTYESQLNQIDTSLCFIIMIIVGTALAYYATKVQRCQLVCAHEEITCDLPDVKSIRILSNFFILPALAFFFQSAECACRIPATNCKQVRSKQMNHAAAFLVLTASLIRYSDLLTNT